MKTIMTSNYARNAKNPNAIGISYKPLYWYRGQMLLQLAPEPRIVIAIKNGEIDERTYTNEYLECLRVKRKLTPEQVLDMIPDGATLLCFESPKDFCHRRVLAEWLNIGTGIVVPEWKSPKEEIKGQILKDVRPYIE